MKRKLQKCRTGLDLSIGKYLDVGSLWFAIAVISVKLCHPNGSHQRRKEISLQEGGEINVNKITRTHAFFYLMCTDKEFIG